MSRNEPFPHRLLTAVSSESMLSDAASLCSETWVRMGQALRAQVVRISDPDELVVHQCNLESGASVVHRESRIRARFSSLLNEDIMQAVGPPRQPDERRHVLPVDNPGWVVLVDFPDSEQPAGDSHNKSSETLLNISRRLLARSPHGHCLFPDTAHLESMAEFAAGAGHEINNPLGSILGQTALLLKNENAIDRRQALETIGGQAWRIRDMIGNTMLFARPPKPQKSSIDPRQLTAEVITTIRQGFRGTDVPIEFQAGASCGPIQADAAQFGSLVSYLIRNSVEEIRDEGAGGHVTVSVIDNAQTGAVEISVSDSSRRVISDVERRHLFDPFYSGRTAGRGLGFGLSLAWQIVRQHAGLLFCVAPDGGLQTHVALPR